MKLQPSTPAFSGLRSTNAVRFKFSWAVWFLVAVHAAVMLAGFIAPYDYETQDREHPYAAPSRIHFVNCQGKLYFRPFVYATKPAEDTLNHYTEDCSQQARIEFFVPGDEYTILGAFHFRRPLFGVQAPAELFLLG